MRLSEVQEQHEIQVAERASSKASRKAPQAWPSPGGNQIPIPKIILVNANPGGQGKIAMAHQILSSIQ
eukprot:3306748-Prymnesium_polylepis.1